MSELVQLIVGLEGSPYLFVGLPCALLTVAGLLSVVLRWPFSVSLLLASLPLAGLFIEIPGVEEIQAQSPLLLIGMSWLLLICISLGLGFARLVSGAVEQGSALLSSFFALVFVIGAGVAGLLVFKPDMLDQLLPDWKVHFGVVLFGCCLLGMALAFVRVLRSATIAMVWLAICVVLGGKVFLDKLPQELEVSDLDLVSADALPDGIITIDDAIRLSALVPEELTESMDPAVSSAVAETALDHLR